MALLPPAARLDLASLGRPIPYPAGSVLISQGEPRTHVYLLRSQHSSVSACVKVTANAANGFEALNVIQNFTIQVDRIRVLR